MAGKERPNQIVHRLINEERKRRGLPWVRWSPEMYRLAKDQANKMAKEGRLFHSPRFALRGGENVWGGKYHYRNDLQLAKDIVNSWMKSHAGHREWLLDPSVKTAGTAISTSRHGTYAAWAFSDQPLHRPIKIKPLKFKMPFKLKVPFFTHLKVRGGEGMLRLPVNILLKCLSVIGIILGAHGFYVYLHRLDFPTVGAQKLFLALSVPVRLEGVVSWMTREGVHGWFIPVVFIVLGFVLWSFSNKVGGQFTLLRKLHLW